MLAKALLFLMLGLVASILFPSPLHFHSLTVVSFIRHLFVVTELPSMHAWMRGKSCVVRMVHLILLLSLHLLDMRCWSRRLSIRIGL